MNEEHLGIHKVLSASVERSTSRVRGQEFKSTKHQAGSARHNLGDDDFWNMSYEERSKVCILQWDGQFSR